MDQLQRKETECEQLVDAHHKSVCEVEEQKKKETTLEEMIAQLQSQMKQLKQEVEAKSDLVSKCIQAATAIFCSEIPEGIVSVETQLSWLGVVTLAKWEQGCMVKMSFRRPGLDSIWGLWDHLLT